MVPEGAAKEGAPSQPPAPTATHPTPPRPTAGQTHGVTETRSHTLAYVGFGVAGLGLVVGVTTGVAVLARSSKLHDACPDAHCPPDAHGDLDGGRRLSVISNVSFVFAGLGAVTGLVSIFARGASEPPKAGRLTPWVGVGSAGLSGVF